MARKEVGLFDPQSINMKQAMKATPWAEHCLVAIDRIKKVGWIVWLIEETESPSWDNPEWAEWIHVEYEGAGSPTRADLVVEGL